MPAAVLGALTLKVARFRRTADEVSPNGVVARSWEADVNCIGAAEADAVYALRSYNLRRTLGWQLRGSGYGDVALTGDLGNAIVRMEVVGEADHLRTSAGYLRVLQLTLREQVS